jgi:transcriptional regulator with XRE-family HTH domain
VNGDAGGVADQLHRFRLSAGLSQEELAARSGLSVRAIGNLERGQSRWPYPATLNRLADALDLDGEVRAEFIGAAGRRLALAGASPGPLGEESQRSDGWHPVPRQLPAPVRGFTGRDAELAALTGLLSPAGGSSPAGIVISVISGTAGVGKTALAVHWAHQAARHFPDGQLYVNLRGFAPSRAPVMAREALRHLLQALAVPAERIPAEVPAQAALYRSLLADKRMLILLDNVRNTAQVEQLLPASPDSLVLVTSRNQLTGLAATHGATELTLGVLTEFAARELLACRLGADRVHAEPDATAEIISRCARLPLALAVLSGRAAARPAFPLRSLAAQLRHETSRLDVLDGGDQGASVRTAFSWSGRQLGARAAEMFRLLGLHPGPELTVSAGASLAGCSLARAHQALAELARAHLVTEHLPGRYSCHGLLRDYAAEQALATSTHAARRVAMLRLVEHYLYSSVGADRVLHPSRQPITLAAPQPGVTVDEFAGISQALTWFHAEHEVLIAIGVLASSSGLCVHARQLAWTMEWPPCVDVGRTAAAKSAGSSSSATKAGGPVAVAGGQGQPAGLAQREGLPASLPEPCRLVVLDRTRPAAACWAAKQ